MDTIHTRRTRFRSQLGSSAFGCAFVHAGAALVQGGLRAPGQAMCQQSSSAELADLERSSPSAASLEPGRALVPSAATKIL
jgi:hypothetical protein